jgi:hypothetical protein
MAHRSIIFPRKHLVDKSAGRDELLELLGIYLACLVQDVLVEMGFGGRLSEFEGEHP